MKEYKTLYIDLDGPVEDQLNAWAEEGFRLVGTIPPPAPMYNALFVLEREREE